MNSTNAVPPDRNRTGHAKRLLGVSEVSRHRGIAWLALALSLSAGCSRTRAERAFREADPDGFAAISAVAHALQERAPAEFEAYWRNLVVVLAQGVDYYGLNAFEAELEAVAPDEYLAFVEVVNALPNEYEFANWIASHQGFLNSLRPRGPTSGTIRDPGLVNYPRFAEPRGRRALEHPVDASRVSDENVAWRADRAGPLPEAMAEARAVRDAETVRDARIIEAISEARALRDAKIARAETLRDARITEVEAARDLRLAEVDDAEQARLREVARTRDKETENAGALWRMEREQEVSKARATMDEALAAVIEAFWEDSDLAELARARRINIRSSYFPDEQIVARTLQMFRRFADLTVGEHVGTRIEEWGAAGEDWRSGMVRWRPVTEERLSSEFRAPWPQVGTRTVAMAHRRAWAEYFAAEARWKLAREAAHTRASTALQATTENAVAARDEALATAERQVSAARTEYEAAREAAEAELEATIQAAIQREE
ncbi:MAG: hypothetical protein OXQ29_16375 [Rhodospirillaceae bacterium]|nr:hypothetical protein [Rhodospirillaceae bacterium]